jgi:hypothetical protein
VRDRTLKNTGGKDGGKKDKEVAMRKMKVRTKSGKKKS